MRLLPPADQDSARCAAVQERLLDYIDGSLAQADLARTQAHLESCATCHQEAARCHAAERALASARHAIPPPGDLRAAFTARLAASSPAATRRRFEWQWAVPALAACALALFLTRSTFHAPTITPNLSGQRIAGISTNRPVMVAPTEPDLRLATNLTAYVFMNLRPTSADESVQAVPSASIYHRSHTMPVSKRGVGMRRAHSKALNRVPEPVAPPSSETLPSGEVQQASTSGSEDTPVRTAENETVMGVCDEDRGFVASTKETREDGNVVDVETKSAPVASLFPLR